MKHKLLHFCFTALFISLLLFTTCFSCFAAVDNLNIYLDQQTFQHIGVGTASVVRQSHLSRASSYIVTTTEDDNGFVLFSFSGNNFVAGQSYSVTFRVARMSGSNARFYFFGNKSDYQQSPREIAFYTSTLSSMTTPDQQWGLINFSFVADGSDLYEVMIVPTSLSTATNNFNVWFSVFTFSRFNPNAGVESRLDEQNSLQDEQNSLLDEQNSRLFEEASSYIFEEPDLSEQWSRFNSAEAELERNAGDVLTNNKIVMGVKAFAYAFENFIDIMLSAEWTAWVVHLMWLAVTCTVFAFVLNIMRNK